MAFEPATVSPLRIQKSNSTTSATSQYTAQSHSRASMVPATPTFEYSSNVHFGDADESELGTPESVIHYSFECEAQEAESPFHESSFMPEPSFVPRRLATIKAPDGRLKTRTSHTVAELVAMRDVTHTPSDDAVPTVSSTASALRDMDDEVEDPVLQPIENECSQKAKPNRRQSFRMKLDMPLSGNDHELSFGLDKEFDRLIGASKRGYHMRQNDDVIVASTRNFSNENQPPESQSTGRLALSSDERALVPRDTKSAGNSPRKASGPITKEPWNGKMRRHSTRRSIIAPEKPMSSVVPGKAIGSLDAIEDQSFLDEPESGVERGRFFVKVIGVKDLNMPLPRNETCRFQLTLDNGLHCVTTAWLELGRTAPIGQEFELTVFDELDFSLTLQTKLERPQSQQSASSIDERSASPSKAKMSKPSAFSRFLSSPKKRRREQELKQEEEAQQAEQRKHDMESRRAREEPSAWELMHNLVGSDGSFAQAVISLQDHEAKAYGRPAAVEVPCYNNWAVEENSTANSTKSKHGGVQRLPPYKIGNLSLQMIFVPRPKGIKEEDMPTSMAACIKQMKAAENTAPKEHEGFLSQQGGDCPYWRRRLFRLNGPNLTSYHETTRQRRANINLTKATKLIDDRSSLTQSSETNGAKKRRKSAFAADEEGYMFVEEGFRIRFANGEIIDFYADSRADKDKWMAVLSEVIGKEATEKKATWTAAVIAKEKAEAAKIASQPRPAVPHKDGPGVKAATRSGLASPPKPARPQSAVYETRPVSPRRPVSPKRPASPTKPKDQPSPKRSSAVGASPKKTTTPASGGRRQAVRSMIF